MQWDREKTLLFIDKYKERSVLWDPTHQDHYNKLKKSDAWVELSTELNIEVDECKKKITSLLASLRREKAKIKKTTGTGKGAEEIYTSSWFAFKPLLFVQDRNKPRHTEDTLQSDADLDTTHPLEQISATATATTSPQSAKPKKRKGVTPEDIMLSTFDILKTKLEQNPSSGTRDMDECDAFGAFIAKKLRSYSQQTRMYVQHHMSDILFSADRGQYEYNKFPNYDCLTSQQASSSNTFQPTSPHQTCPMPLSSEETGNTYTVLSPQVSDNSQQSEGFMSEFGDLIN